MSRVPRAAPHRERLQRDLKGSFSARARGLLAPEFVLLSPGGEEFGRLRSRGLSGAEFRSSTYPASFEAYSGRYRMLLANDEEVLSATQRRSTREIEISCGGQAYKARIDLLRNFGLASYPDGERAAHLSGGLTGRSYEATFAAKDWCAFQISILLLWLLAANRRRAYRKGAPAGGGEV